VDFRVSTLRTLFGEKSSCACSIIAGRAALEEIGMSATAMEEMRFSTE
jgi:hypothetical protein